MALRLRLAQQARSAACGATLSTAAGVYSGDHIVPYVSELAFDNPLTRDTIPAYRVLDEDGTVRADATEPDLPKDELLHMYRTMVRIRTMDKFFNEAQRQGRISFYMQAAGEEAIHIGVASTLKPDDDVLAQYREAGILMWRGFSLQNFADQCFSNMSDLGKGRQMPVHYGSAALHYHTISSPLTTQLPQAVGAAYALKLDGTDRVTACFFGDGSASEGDFHAAMNFSTTLEVPMLFCCRNNGFAISTPVKEQFRGDGIASRAAGYGMRSVRVDGNDLFAVRDATRAARALAREHSAPVLLEFMSYREGDHSTSDDSTQYRGADEIADWRQHRNPVTRLRLYLEGKEWWSEDEEVELVAKERKAVLAALALGEKKPKPGVDTLFSDVYSDMPWHLEEQRVALEEHIAKYPERYTSGGH